MSNNFEFNKRMLKEGIQFTMIRSNTAYAKCFLGGPVSYDYYFQLPNKIHPVKVPVDIRVTSDEVDKINQSLIDGKAW